MTIFKIKEQKKNREAFKNKHASVQIRLLNMTDLPENRGKVNKKKMCYWLIIPPRHLW